MIEYKKGYIQKIGAIILNRGGDVSSAEIDAMWRMKVSDLKEKLRRLEE
jgi:hypothetical protein